MNKNLNMKAAFVCVFVFVCLVSLAVAPRVKSQTAGAILINSDGSVSGTTNIQRDGNFYRLTANLYDSPIVVLRNNIVIDGEGFVLQGAGGWGTPSVADRGYFRHKPHMQQRNSLQLQHLRLGSRRFRLLQRQHNH